MWLTCRADMLFNLQCRALKRTISAYTSISCQHWLDKLLEDGCIKSFMESHGWLDSTMDDPSVPGKMVSYYGTGRKEMNPHVT